MPGARQPAAGFSESPAPLVVRLASALRDAGVSYCHWKSNLAIAQAEQGEGDLDLLVARSDTRVFNRVLNECGFVSALRQGSAPVPAIADFFGFDSAIDRFVHVHAHYQLVLGHDRTKNYRLPIEDAYLGSADRAGLLPVPAAEFEFIVLVIRMVLKYAIFDEIVWNGMRGKRTQPKPSEQAELAHLRQTVDMDLVRKLIGAHLPFIDQQLFTDAEAFTRGALSVRERLSVARRLISRLEPYARNGPAVDGMLRVWRRIEVAARRRIGGGRGYRLVSGGAIIAIIGGDGSGKSTVIAEIGRWLGSTFETREVHLGKPPWSLTTYGVRGGLKVGAMLGAPWRRGQAGPAPVDDVESGGDLRSLGRLVCKSRDRYLAYRRARRVASHGGIVASDRYPHELLTLMDVPQIARLTEGRQRTLLEQRLAAVEERYHDLIVSPELVIVLRLDPEEAARRKVSEPYDYVLERAREIWDVDWSGSEVQVVDASRPKEAVIAEVKRLIWSALV